METWQKTWHEVLAWVAVGICTCWESQWLSTSHLISLISATSEGVWDLSCKVPRGHNKLAQSPALQSPAGQKPERRVVLPLGPEPPARLDQWVGQHRGTHLPRAGGGPTGKGAEGTPGPHLLWFQSSATPQGAAYQPHIARDTACGAGSRKPAVEAADRCGLASNWTTLWVVWYCVIPGWAQYLLFHKKYTWKPSQAHALSSEGFLVS